MCKFISTILLLLSFTLYHAQNHTFNGSVHHCDKNTPMEGVSIKIKSIKQIFHTNKDGKFSIGNIPDGKQELIISSNGYETKRVNIEVHNDIKNYTLNLCPDKVQDIDQVVITSSRSLRKLKDVAIPVQVISSEQLEKSKIINFRDFLEQELSGVEFTNHGGYANISLLGFGGKYVLFLVDGERLAGETFDNIDYNRIDINSIERIEIIKGASSSLYGSNAIGGVINIITKKPQRPIQINTGSQLGSNNEQNYNFSLGSKQKWGSMQLSSFYKKRDPYLLKDTAPLTQEYEDGHIIHKNLSETYIAGYTDYGLSPKISFNLNSKIRTEINGGYYFQERNTGGLDGYKIRNRFNNYSGGLKTFFDLGNTTNLVISGSFDEYQKLDYYKLLNLREKNYENQIWRVSAIADKKINHRHSLVLGTEVYAENLLSFMFTNNDIARRKVQNYSVFTQQDWKMSENLTLVTGARLDYHSQFKSKPTFRLSGMYKLTPNWSVRGGYSGGFRAPTLKELFTDWFHPHGGGFQILGNKKMRAEKSHNFTISSDYSHKKINLTLLGQYSTIKDKINAIWISADTIQYQNVGKANILSAELSLAYRLSKELKIKGAYSFVNTTPKENSVTRSHTFTFNTEYKPSFIKKYTPTFILSGKYFGGMDIYTTTEAANRGNIAGTTEQAYKIYYEPYSIWRIQASLPLPYSFNFNAGVNNLFGYKPKFSSFYSSISPGRTYYIGLKWNLN